MAVNFNMVNVVGMLMTLVHVVQMDSIMDFLRKREDLSQVSLNWLIYYITDFQKKKEYNNLVSFEKDLNKKKMMIILLPVPFLCESWS